MATPSRELLIVSPKRWDEACFSVPAVRALAGSGIGIGVLCQPHQKEFWETLPELEVSTPDSMEAQWQGALLWEDGELAKFVLRSGIHKRLGPEIGKLPKQLTETLKDVPHPAEHRVQFYLKAVAEMGVETAKPEYFSLARSTDAGQSSSLLLCPDSDFGPSHEWPLEKWQELAAALMEQGCKLTITGLSGERQLGNELHAMPGIEADFEAVELAQAPLELLSRFNRLITADGSIAHLAAHMGATCVTLFGPNDSAWKRPLGRRHRVVRKVVECAPCLSSKCALDERCQSELEVDAVMEAFEEVKV